MKVGKVMNIEERVHNELEKVLDNEEVISALQNTHFFYGDGKYEPGSYVYEKNGIYHYVGVGDRGGIIEEIKSENMEDVLYKIYSGVTFNKATQYAMVNKKKNEDWRRLLFSKQLEILRCINEQYYNRRFDEIQNILISNPYRDNI